VALNKTDVLFELLQVTGACWLLVGNVFRFPAVSTGIRMVGFGLFGQK
jgi:hypothetical protein